MIPEQKYDGHLERQINDLQTKLAYQEDTVQTLNDIVSEQQQDIINLKTQMKQLVGELRSVLSDLQPDGSVTIGSEKPPHY